MNSSDLERRLTLKVALPVVLTSAIAVACAGEAIVVLGREHPGERGDVGGGREVEATQAGARRH
jgi:hypothetical protein